MQVNDAKPPHAEADVLPKVKPFVVRPTVHDRLRHAFQCGTFDGAVTIEIESSTDPAHEVMSSTHSPKRLRRGTLLTGRLRLPATAFSASALQPRVYLRFRWALLLLLTNPFNSTDRVSPMDGNSPRRLDLAQNSHSGTCLSA